MGSQFRTRGYAPFSLVHFTCRGYKKRRIFLDEFDHLDFLTTLRSLIDGLTGDLAPKLLAYAQMPNHQHVFLQAGTNGEVMAKLMRSLCTRYALSHNDRHDLKGPVFQRPFRGKVISGGDYIANTFAYIHLNRDQTLRTENSSHAYYAGLADDPHIDPSVAWRVFGGPEGYVKFFDDTERIRAARSAAKLRFEQ